MRRRRTFLKKSYIIEKGATYRTFSLLIHPTTSDVLANCRFREFVRQHRSFSFSFTSAAFILFSCSYSYPTRNSITYWSRNICSAWGTISLNTLRVLNARYICFRWFVGWQIWIVWPRVDNVFRRSNDWNLLNFLLTATKMNRTS